MVRASPKLKKKWEYLKSKADALFGVDLRSLALLRICVAIILLVNIVNLASDFKAFFTNSGIIPRQLVQSKGWNLSIYLLSSSIRVQEILLILQIIFAIALLFGFYTKLASIASWFFFLSMRLRNPFIFHGGDGILRLMLFWGMFLPWANYYSLDSFFSVEKRQKRLMSLGTFALLIQVLCVYFFAFILKLGKEWSDGSAVFYSLNYNMYVSEFGKFLLNFPVILKPLTYAVHYFELFGSIMLFFPFFINRIRITLVFLFIFMQFMLGLSFRLSTFPWIASAMMIPFISSEHFDSFQKKARNNAKILKFHYIYKKLFLLRLKAKKRFYFTNLFKKYHFHFKTKLISNIIILISLGFVIMSNLGSIGLFKMPRQVEQTLSNFGLSQKWNMFAPSPGINDGWFIIIGKQKNGNKLNLLNPTLPISFEMPSKLSSTFKNLFWAKYYENLWTNRKNAIPYHFSMYLCKQWNRKYEGLEKLDEVQVIYMLANRCATYPLCKPNMRLIGKYYC